MVGEKNQKLKIVSAVSLLSYCDNMDGDIMNGDREHRKYLAIWGVGGMLILSCPRNNSYADVQHVMDHFDSLDDCSAHIHSSCSLTVGRIYFCAPIDVGESG